MINPSRTPPSVLPVWPFRDVTVRLACCIADRPEGDSQIIPPVERPLFQIAPLLPEGKEGEGGKPSAGGGLGGLGRPEEVFRVLVGSSVRSNARHSWTRRQTRGLLRRAHGRFDLRQRARQVRRQAFRQQADRPARPSAGEPPHICACRPPALVGAVRRQLALRPMPRALRRPCVAPRPAGNILLSPVSAVSRRIGTAPATARRG